MIVPASAPAWMRRPIRLAGALLVLVLTMFLYACSRAPERDGPPQRDGPPGTPPSAAPAADAVPRPEPRSRYGNPESYEVFGRAYHVMDSAAGYRERGVASWYGTKFHGRRTSSGEPYDMHLMTAAHKSLPLPTFVEVTNLENGRRAVVRVNDRGPFHDNRIIDLSYAAAGKLGIIANGTGLVEVRAIDPGAPQVAGSALPPVPRAPGPAVNMPVSNAPVSIVAPAPVPPKIFLQAGAFAQETNAQRLRSRLLSMVDVPVSLQQLPSDTLPMHRVRLGPLASVATADRLTQRMLEAGLALPQIVIE